MLRRLRTLARMWLPRSRHALVLLLVFSAVVGMNLHWGRSTATPAQSTSSARSPGQSGADKAAKSWSSPGLASRKGGETPSVAAVVSDVPSSGGAVGLWLWSRLRASLGLDSEGQAGADTTRSPTLASGDSPQAWSEKQQAAIAAAAEAKKKAAAAEAAAVVELTAQLAELEAQVEAARGARDNLLGLLAAVELDHVLFAESEERMELTPVQRYQKLKNALILKTQEVLRAKDYLLRVKDYLNRHQMDEGARGACGLALVGSYTHGWTISAAVLGASPEEATVYSFGTGKDVSFDLALIGLFEGEGKDIQVHGFDPDARSIDWVVKQRLTKRLVLHQFALGKTDGPMQFWQLSKRSGSSVSNEFSKTQTEDVQLTVDGKTFKTILDELGHRRLELVKVDVEGYEYSIIDQLAANAVPSTHLLLDMHAGMLDILPDLFRASVRGLESLLQSGWRVLAVDERHGRKFTFVRVCTNDTVLQGRGDCLCCYPDVPYQCLLAP